jgi:hypothetical protein
LPGLQTGRGELQLELNKRNRARTSWQSKAIALENLRGYSYYRLLPIFA